MKTNKAIVAAAFLVAAVSCRREDRPQDFPQFDGRTNVTMSVSAATKGAVLQDSDESAFSSIQFFVFDESGKLEDYRKTSSSSAELSVVSGKKTFVAMLNADGDFSDAGTLAALNARTTDLKDNAGGHFIMLGSKSQEVSGSSSAVTVNVHRQVARIRINRISTDFESTALKSSSFKIDRIYVINAAGDCRVDGSENPSFWYNESGYHKGGASPLDAADHLISDNVSIDLSGNASYGTAHVFYVYPNDFSAHATVLELSAKIDGESDFYCIDFTEKGIGAIEPNKTYTVDELVIKHRGNDHDGDGVIDGTASFDCSISIEDWDTGLAPYTETL